MTLHPDTIAPARDDELLRAALAVASPAAIAERFPRELFYEPARLPDSVKPIVQVASTRCMVITFTDTDASKAAVIRSEEHHRQVMDNATEDIPVLQDERIVFANRRVLQLTGCRSILRHIRASKECRAMRESGSGRSGAADCIVKALNPATVPHTVEQAVRKRSAANAR